MGYDAEFDRPTEDYFVIQCFACRASNGGLRIHSSDGRVIGVTVSLDDELELRPMAYQGMPRYGPTRRAWLRRKTDPRHKLTQQERSLRSIRQIPPSLWLHCRRCNVGQLLAAKIMLNSIVLG